jgi:hypothetical protein
MIPSKIQDFVHELETANLYYEVIVDQNQPEHLIRYPEFEDCLWFNGFSYHKDYETHLEELYTNYISFINEKLKETGSDKERIDHLRIQITRFKTIHCDFYTVVSENPHEDIEYAYRSNMVYHFDQDPGVEITPIPSIFRYVSPFILLQKLFLQRVVRFLLDLKSEIDVKNELLQKVDYTSIHSELGLRLGSKNKDERITRLDIRQTALLYKYLMDHGAIISMPNMHLSELLHHLTGYSDQKIRTDEGLGVIRDIEKGKKAKHNFWSDKNKNLKAVKELLNEVISIVESKIKD